MIAKVGYPGAQNFNWARFHKRANAMTWLSTQHEWQGQAILPEKEAARIKYRDGSRVYPYTTCADIPYEGEQFQD